MIPVGHLPLAVYTINDSFTFWVLSLRPDNGGVVRIIKDSFSILTQSLTWTSKFYFDTFECEVSAYLQKPVHMALYEIHEQIFHCWATLLQLDGDLNSLPLFSQ